jgi:VCBS repeat protein
MRVLLVLAAVSVAGLRFEFAADCNGNGIDDLLDIARTDLKFSYPEVILENSTATSLAVGDLDSDGNIDVVLASWSLGEVSVVPNRGSGSFGEERRFPVGVNPKAMAVADFDGDSRMEIAAVLFTSPAVIDVLHDQGNGVYGSPDEYATGFNFPDTLAAADLDRDGSLYLAVLLAKAFIVFRNRGTGTFEPGVVHGAGGHDLVIADLDRDGDLDAAIGGSPSAFMLFNSGNGAFDLKTPLGGVSRVLGSGDYDGDGNIDLLTLEADSLRILLNLGLGDFQAKDGPPFDGFSDTFASADFNGDGRLDLALAGPAIRFLENLGALRFERRADFGPSGIALVPADFDGDGAIDLTVLSYGGVRYLKNRGDFSFLAPTWSFSANDPSDVVASDFDGDQDIDIVNGDMSRRLFLHRNAGNRSFDDEQIFWGEFPPFLSAADLDGDGDQDLIAHGSESDYFYWLANGGTGKFSMGGSVTGPWPYQAADLDGDGFLDLIGNAIYLNQRDGSFRRWSGDAGGQAAADIDGDGDLDLIDTDRGSDQVVILFNEGQLRFDSPSFYPTGFGPGLVIAADLDGDGRLDLVTANSEDLMQSGDDSISVLKNRGHGAFGPPVDYQGVGGKILPADLDGDQDIDLITTGNENYVIHNEGSGQFRIAQRLGKDFLHAVADLDGDGDLDLAGTSGLIYWNLSRPVHSQDRDRDGIPDECEGMFFHRGDPNGDGRLDISDAMTLLDFEFLDGNPLGCLESADATNDGRIDISDVVTILYFLFLSGPPLAPPGPPSASCGPDPDPPGSPADLGCRSYGPCP